MINGKKLVETEVALQELGFTKRLREIENRPIWTPRGVRTINGQSPNDQGDITVATGGSLTTKDEGSNLSTATASLDFVGAGVTATASGDDITVTIPGGAATTIPFVTIGNTAGLSAERALTGSSSILVTDNGANSTAVLSVIAGGVDHGSLGGLSDDDHTQYLLASGTRALSGNWDAGSFEVRAQTFQSDVTTGTAPLIVASTTKVTNLNADLLDDQTGSYYLDSANFTGTNWTDLTDGGATTLHKHDHGGMDGLADDDHTQYALLAGRSGGQTLIGGTAASNSLTLQSTSNATKGNILMSDAVGLAAGTVSLPSLAFSDNLDTGFYEPTTGASGNIALAINGSEALRVNSQVAWGWNGTAPTTTAVHVANLTNTTDNSRSIFMDFKYIWNPAIGLSASFSALRFEVNSSSQVYGKVIDGIGKFSGTASTANLSVFVASPGYTSTATVTGGTRRIFGFELTPVSGTGGNYTGGTIEYGGLYVPAKPTGYTGGATLNYYSMWALEGLFIHNDNGGDYDARFEGDTDANLLFVDASADTVQVGAATASDSAKFYVSGKASTSGEMEINGDLNHDGTNVGFYGVTPVARSSAYSPSNVTTDRAYDANSTTVDEVADVLGTLIADLQATGIIG